MRVLVCGSREWDDPTPMFDVLDGLRSRSHVLVVIEGGAKGADALAANWCALQSRSVVRHERYPADWKTYGKAAGPKRNQRMLDEGKPDVVIAFKDGFQRDPAVTVWSCRNCGPHEDSSGNWCDAGCGRDHGGMTPTQRPSGPAARGGTEHMVRIAKAAGVPTYIVSHA